MEENRCPYCGYDQFGIGKQSGYACITPDTTFSLRSYPLYHVICLNCGAVVKSFVEKPEAFQVEEDK